MTDVFLAVGQAAAERGRGVVLLFDEVQFLSKQQLEAVIEALHKMVQRKLPITLVAAGLPQIAELAGDAKSYAERLFEFPAIGVLSATDAEEALARPAQDEGVTYAPDALTKAVAITGGYPYFLQELGYAVWTVADGPMITRDDVMTTVPGYGAKLDDELFFRVRLDRATELQRAYLRAMAQLGPEPQKASDVAEVMGRTSQNLAPTRAELINMGLLYTPEHGYAAFTVPHFDKFILRAIRNSSFRTSAVAIRSSTAEHRPRVGVAEDQSPRRVRCVHVASDDAERQQLLARSGRSGSRCPSAGTRRSRSTASSGSPRPRRRRRRGRPASPPRASPCRGRSRGGPRAGPRRTSRSRVVYQSTSTPVPAQRLLGGAHPAVVGEVLAPAVEAAAVAPDLLDDRADAAVAAREQALDDAGLAVVVAEADRAAVLLVGADLVAQLLQPGVGGLVGRAARPTGTACAAWARTRRSRPCSGCRCARRPRGPWR